LREGVLEFFSSLLFRIAGVRREVDAGAAEKRRSGAGFTCWSPVPGHRARLGAFLLIERAAQPSAGSADALWAELAAAKKEGRGTIIFNWTPNFTDGAGFTFNWPFKEKPRGSSLKGRKVNLVALE
jgi:hypothetical protein